MANGSDEIKIYGAIRCKTEEGKAAFAGQVFDETQGRFQSQINQDVNVMASQIGKLSVDEANIVLSILGGKQFLLIEDRDTQPSTSTSAVCGRALCGYAICGTN